MFCNTTPVEFQGYQRKANCNASHRPYSKDGCQLVDEGCVVPCLPEELVEGVIVHMVIFQTVETTAVIFSCQAWDNSFVESERRRVERLTKLTKGNMKRILMTGSLLALAALPALADGSAPDASTVVTTATTVFGTVGALVASAVGFFVVVKIVKWIRK